MRDNIFNNPCLLWNRNHNKWGFLHEEYVADPARTIYILQKKGLKMAQILYKDIIKNKEINEFIKKGDANLATLGYTVRTCWRGDRTC